MIPPDVPIDLDRQEAARQAAAELANPAYRSAQPTWLERLVGWLVDQASDLAGRASAAAPGGWWGILGLTIVVVVTVALIRWRIGPVTRAQSLDLVVDPSISSAQYRDQSQRSAAAGQWEAALSQRMAAMVRGAEERGLAPVRPGRTVDEFALLMAEAAPSAAGAMNRAVVVFDRVRYGGRPADEQSYLTVLTADEALTDAYRRPRPQAVP